MIAQYKQCPFCSEQILSAAIRCKHCKSDLTTNRPTNTRQEMPMPEYGNERRRITKSIPPQFEKWAKIREKGRSRYIWLYGVVGFGVTCGVLFGWLFPQLFLPAFRTTMSSLAASDNVPHEISDAALANATDGFGAVTFVLSMILFPIGGYAFGVLMWKNMEKKFEQAQNN